MNRDHFQKKLQAHRTKAQPRFAQATATGFVIYPSDEILHELQVLPIELRKKALKDG